MIEFFVAQIPEAIFFALFMIYTKQLKEKRVLFIILMLIEYIILKQFLHYTVYFQILYTFITYIILKILYKDRSQIIDIFTFTIASIFLILTSALMYFIAYYTYKDINICIILHKILIFALLFIFKNKLYNIQKLYKKLWNRNKDIIHKNKIKTTTFRAINIVAFNIIFYVINIGMLYIIIKNGGV